MPPAIHDPARFYAAVLDLLSAEHQDEALAAGRFPTARSSMRMASYSLLRGNWTRANIRA